MQHFNISFREPQIVFNNTERILDVKQSNIKIGGDGIYIFEDVRKGDFIGEYTGDILKHNKNTCVGDYSISISNKYYINSQHFPRCYMAMINDAHGTKFKNNCEFKLITTDKHGKPLPENKRKVKIYATRNIKAGSELFASYGKNYWKSRDK
jgi:uncharacterized protein